MNAERSAMENIDRNRQRHLELAPLMRRAHEKGTVEVFNDPDASIQMELFESVHSKETIAADVELTQRLKKKFAAQSAVEGIIAKKIAEVFEAIVITQAEMSNWLGPTAHTLKSSEYDDFVNKVDMIVEWTTAAEEKQILALAVDVTFSAQAIGKKLAAIKEEIDSGQLGSVKYLKDADGNCLKPGKNVPRVVIGVSESLVNELAQLWVNGDKKALGAHPVQKLIVNQIALQMSRMRAYAQSIGRVHVVEAYDQALVAIRRLQDNQKSFLLTDALKNDKVGAQISEQTNLCFPRQAIAA